MTPHKEWFCEYEIYEGAYVFLGDESTTKNVRQGRVRPILQDERCRTLPGVQHIPGLARNFISIRKMSDAVVHIVFKKETCKMILRGMVLIRGVRNGNLYKMLGSTISNGCNSSVVHEGEEDKTPMVSREETILWHQRLGHTREKGLQALHDKGMVEGMYDCTMDFDLCEHCMINRIE